MKQVTEFKVVTQSDKFFGGKFNGQKLEQLLNDYGKHGWEVVTSTTQEFPMGFGKTTRQEIVIILQFKHIVEDK